MPSLLTLTVNGSDGAPDPAAALGQGASLLCSRRCPSCGHDQYALCDSWPERLAHLAALLQPHLASKAVLGIFIGDELLHVREQRLSTFLSPMVVSRTKTVSTALNFPDSEPPRLQMSLGYETLVNLSSSLRAEFGPDVILYANMEGTCSHGRCCHLQVPTSIGTIVLKGIHGYRCMWLSTHRWRCAL